MPEYIFNESTFELKYPAIMGILNLTPDSFSDGGEFDDPGMAVERANLMYEQGAQIIDLGGESTRPGSDPVSEQEELARVLPVLERLPRDRFLISLDPTKPADAGRFASLLASTAGMDGTDGGGRVLVAFANHQSSWVLALRREGGGLGPLDLRQRMYIMATEPIEAGREIRVDYESGSASYWGARRLELPAETSWRSAWVQPPPPPPNGPEAPPWMASQMVALHASREGRLVADGRCCLSGTL